MKRIFLVLCLILVVQYSYPQQLNIELKYEFGEHSKDSFVRIETITLKNNHFSHFIETRGQRKPEQSDVSKECYLYDETIGHMVENIRLRGFDKNDSLISDIPKSGRSRGFENIYLKIELGSEIYNIKVIGDIEEFKDKELYKSLVDYLKLLNEVLSLCSG